MQREEEIIDLQFRGTSKRIDVAATYGHTTYRNELLELKCKCLEHTHCDCEQIRDDLRSTVAQLNP
jgi:hypothetical protein